MNRIAGLLLMLVSAVAVAAAAAASTPDAPAGAAPLRPVAAAYTLEAGSSLNADTYLSPLRYRGYHLGLNYERFQAMRFSPRRWVMRLDAGVGFDRGRNPARNASMTGLGLRFSWSMLRRFDNWPVAGLTLMAGATARLDAGVFNLPRNGNNPVSARAAVTVGVTGAAIYRLRLGRLPVTLRYQPVMPLLGVFFSPQYGELYYEISLGDTRSLVHFANPATRFAIDNLVTADLHLGATALRVGYSGSYLSTGVNNLVGRSVTHSFLIGISGEWLSLNPRRRAAAHAPVIQAF